MHQYCSQMNASIDLSERAFCELLQLNSQSLVVLRLYAEFNLYVRLVWATLSACKDMKTPTPHPPDLQSFRSATTMTRRRSVRAHSTDVRFRTRDLHPRHPLPAVLAEAERIEEAQNKEHQRETGGKKKNRRGIIANDLPTLPISLC